jgi:4-hydroxymandelate oxidase
LATDEFFGKEFSCHFCDICDGTGCIGEMPGMGGPNESRNFLLNCAGWERIRSSEQFSPYANASIRLAPITGGVENIGYPDEKQFYFDMIDACCKANVPISIGDGCPDFKLQYGIEAVQAAQKKYKDIKAAVFVKPYPDEKIYERFEWAKPVAEIVGIDIDSYNIVTMRNLVHLEKKTPEQLLAIKAHLAKSGIPFAIKGIFNALDIDMVKAVHPDIAYISNHGGRVDTRAGSTAEFLRIFHKTLLDNCGELWVDGGIRSARDIETASAYGASTVLEGRPFISALCMGGSKAVAELAKSLGK